MNDHELDPQVIAAIARATRAAKDPETKTAIAAIFAALSRRDAREREAWSIIREVASYPLGDGIDVLRDRACRLIASE